MINLFGKRWSRTELEQRTGQIAQIIGIKELTLNNGPEDGVRVLQFRTGTSLNFTINIDRGFDLHECSWGAFNLGWMSATGTRNPALHEFNGEDGFGWLRSFSGLNATCGLDQILFPCSDDVTHYNFPARKEITQPLHGRIANTPAKLIGYGERWNTDGTCTLWAKGLVKQSAVFGENLWLYRTVESDVGSNKIRLHDEVVNMGFSSTAHMYLYHLNLGFPLLDEGAEYIAPIDEIIWASHSEGYEDQNTGYQIQPAPQQNFSEQVYEHNMSADDQGKVPVMLVNRRLNGHDGLAVKITTFKSQFPCQLQWQALGEGCYTMGIEPSTHHVLGKKFARERNEIRWLKHRESYSYDLEFEVFHTSDTIDKEIQKIHDIKNQPSDKYPKIKENWFELISHLKPQHYD